MASPAVTELLANIPSEMLARKQWVCYKLGAKKANGDFKKDPYPVNGPPGVHASCNNPSDWSTFEEACAAVAAGRFDGISYVLTLEDKLVCADMDCVIDNAGNHKFPWVQGLLDDSNPTYAEVSESGHGYHVFGNATIPANTHPINSTVELYRERKIIAMTGRVVDFRLDIYECDFKQLYARVKAKEFVPSEKRTEESSPKDTDDPSGEDWARIGEVARTSGATTGDELEAAVRSSDPEHWQARDAKKKNRNGKSYTRYSVDNFLAEQPQPALVEVDAAAKEEQERLTFTDAGNGQRYVLQNIEDVRFCKQLNKNGWFVWNGQYWKPDAIGVAMELARTTISKMLEEASAHLAAAKVAVSRAEASEVESEIQRAHTQLKTAQAENNWALASFSHRKLSDMLAQASQGTSLSIEAGLFDAHPELLNLQNGTLNLQRMEFYAARREDLLTQIANVTFNPAATCPLWQKFVDDVTQNDKEMAAFLQRVFGYLLTGEQTEQCFFVFHGPSGTGKSTYWKTLRGMMGDYFVMVPTGLFLKKGRNQQSNGNNATPGLVSLVGKRIAVCVEMEEGDHFDAGLIKLITGGDSLPARPLYAVGFTFQPQCKPVFLTNFVPGTTDFSGAMEDRAQLLKFERKFRGTAEEIKDLDVKLADEYSGILNWALDGLKDYRKRGGLCPPEKVRESGKEYMTDQNPVARWLEESTLKKLNGEVTPAAAFDAYQKWAEERNEICRSERWFGIRMGELGFKSEPTNGRRSYAGLALLIESPQHI